jgi:hypothetical protein
VETLEREITPRATADLSISKKALRHFLPDRYADDQKDQAHDEEEKEKELGDAGGSRSDSSKSEQRRDQRDHEKNSSPL